jgi:nucleoside-diphosphate-sugar epimerase
MKKILVTGAFGQIGSELVPYLQKEFGKENIVALGHQHIDSNFDGILEKADSRDKKSISDIIKKHNIGTIYHLVSLLSAKGEIDPFLTWDININGLKNILDLGIENNLKIFWPSSIAVFGPTTPRNNTPQNTILEPTTMYGVTKLAGEGLCRYYHKKYKLDIRSIRYPGIISWKTPPGGGTTDYAVAIFYDGIKTGKYECFVKPDTMLPMMYIDDAIRATVELMKANLNSIENWNSYNLAAISFKAKDLVAELKKYIPKLKVTYKPDYRQKIADSWPRSIDDSLARKDWKWRHEYDLAKMTKTMVESLQKVLDKNF